MKSINDIRVHMTELSETTDDAEMRKLSTLVRSGLFDAKKLTLLKRALNKDNLKMTKAERDTLLELLDKLLNVVTTNQGVFQKVKQSVSEDLVLEDYEFSMARSQLKTIIRDAQALLDQIQGEGEMESWMQSKITLAADYIGAVTDNVVSGESEIKKIKEDYEEISLEEAKELVSVDVNQMPAMLILKRRAIRVFPDGQKVALYFSDRLNKFVTVPFSSIGLSEAVEKQVGPPDPSKVTVGRDPKTGRWTKKQETVASKKKPKIVANPTTNATFSPAPFPAEPEENKKYRARRRELAALGQANKMARRAAKQGEIRDTLKSTIPGTFGAAYRATGSVAGAAGVALGVAARKAGLQARLLSRGMKRSANPGAGPIKEAFESKLKNLRELNDRIGVSAGGSKAAPALQMPAYIPKNAPVRNYTMPLPANSNLTAANSAAIRRAAISRAKLRAGVTADFPDEKLADLLKTQRKLKTIMKRGGNADEISDVFASKISAEPGGTAEWLRRAKMANVEIPTPPGYVIPSEQPAAKPLPAKAPAKAPDITPAAEPAAAPQLVVSPAPAAATAPKAEPATAANPKPQGRSRAPKPPKKGSRLPPVIPAINLSPWDISAGKGSKNQLGKYQGIDPFASQTKGGSYGGTAQTRYIEKIGRESTKAMARMEEQTRSWGSGLVNVSANNNQGGSNSGGKEWDITEPQPKASDKLRLDTLKGINPSERGTGKSPWETDALQAQQRQLSIRAQRAMSQQYESVLVELQNIISENIQSKELQIGEEYITINNGMAKKIVHVYESVNKINKVKMEKMLNENVDSFTKVLQFATKN